MVAVFTGHLAAIGFVSRLAYSSRMAIRNDKLLVQLTLMPI
jgi:hypothetical protein